MLDIGWTELLVVGVVALVVIGPNELPRVLRTAGQGVRKLRRMAGEFQGQFNEALREAELSDLKDSVSGLRNDLSGLASDARSSIAKALPENPLPTNPLQDIATDLKAPTGSVEAGTALPPADTVESQLPPPGDLEPHPFETVEAEVRTAAAAVDLAPSVPAAPEEKPKRRRVAAKAPSTESSSAAEAAPAAKRPAVRRSVRKPAADVTEPEIAEAVADLDGAAPPAPVKRVAKPRAKAKPATGNEGPGA